MVTAVSPATLDDLSRRVLDDEFPRRKDYDAQRDWHFGGGSIPVGRISFFHVPLGMLFAVQYVLGKECAIETGLLRTIYDSVIGKASHMKTGPASMRAYIRAQDSHNKIDWTRILSSLHPHAVRLRSSSSSPRRVQLQPVIDAFVREGVPMNQTRRETWQTLLDSMAWIAVKHVVTLGRYQTILPALCKDWGNPAGRTWADAMDCAARYLTNETPAPQAPPPPTLGTVPATKAARALLTKCVQVEPSRDPFAVTIPRAARMMVLNAENLARFIKDPQFPYPRAEQWLAKYAQWSDQRFATLYMHFMLCDGPLDLVCSRAPYATHLP